MITDVVIVSTHMLPTLGGVESYTDSLAASLEEAGYRVTLVTTTPRPTREATVVRAARLLGGRFPVPFGFVTMFREAAKLYASSSPPVTLIQTRFYPLGLFFALIARSRGAHTVVIDHSSGHMEVGSPLQAVANLYDHASTFALAKAGVDFWSVSAASRDWLHHFGVDVTRILPNAVASSLFAKTRARTAPREDRVALYGGRLIADKGIAESISAIRRLRAAGSKWTLQVAGDGPLRDYVVNEASKDDAITYLGALSHPGFLETLAVSQALLLPSSYPEGLPTVALEAGALGVPVVATDRGGLGELLGGGSRGWVLPDASPASIEAALVDIEHAIAPERTAKMREYVQAHHNWSTVAQALHEAIAASSELLSLDGSRAAA